MNTGRWNLNPKYHYEYQGMKCGVASYPIHPPGSATDGVYLNATSYGVGAGRSSEVERSLMVRWVVGSILHGVDPLRYFSFQPVLHDWCNKGRGMCYPVCGMVHIK